MAHVTFIHGIGNKPAPEQLLPIWQRALSTGGLDLGDQGVTSSLVYWADVLYAAPDPDVAAYESLLEHRADQVDAGGDADLPVPRNAGEAAFLDGLRDRLTSVPDETPAGAPIPPLPIPGAKPLERVPLPWFLKKRFLDTFLRDVHHYLFDVTFAPRPGSVYQVQQEIRRRFVAALTAPRISRPHVVVSHSMGTVIAYDCLKRVEDCASVDGLMTLGSPLGIDEVQDKLQPGWTRADGFPSARMAGRWINVADPLDVVAGPDPKIGNDFLNSGRLAVEDVSVVNEGYWRHSSVKYLRRNEVREALAALLQS